MIPEKLFELLQSVEDVVVRAKELHNGLEKSETLLAFYTRQEIFTLAELLCKTLQDFAMTVSGTVKAKKCCH